MNHRTLGFLILILGALPTSCSFLPSSSGESNPSSFEEQTEQEYLDFWEPDTQLHFSMTTPYDSLKAIQDAYFSGTDQADDEVYHIADLIVDMTTPTYTKHYVLDDVGIRMKGNTSRSDFMNEDGSFFDLIHYKVSFDEFAPGRKFLGMKKLDMKWNRNYDATQIKQLYSYKMFEAAGVIAPKSTISPFTLTTTSLPGGGSSTVELGLYQLIEAVDKTFIKRRFPANEEDGNLYKCTWGSYKGEWTGSDLLSSGAVTKSGSNYVRTPNGRIGIEVPDSGYYPNYKLKTNEDAPDYSDLATLIGVLNSTQDYSNSTVLGQIESLVDVDNFLRYEAVSYLLGDPDDTRNNYNNYYIYFTSATRKAYFIPFDFDRCLGIVRFWNPTNDAMTSVTPFSNQAAGASSEQRNPLYKFLIINGGSATYRQQYATYLADLVKGEWFTDVHFKAMYDTYEASYNGLEPVTFKNRNDNLLYTSWALNETGDGSGTVVNLSFTNYRSRKYATIFNALEASYPNLLD